MFVSQKYALYLLGQELFVTHERVFLSAFGGKCRTWELKVLLQVTCLHVDQMLLLAPD